MRTALVLLMVFAAFAAFAAIASAGDTVTVTPNDRDGDNVVSIQNLI